MTWLRKHKGGTSIGPHHWPHDGAVAEVPDHLAGELLAIPGAGYVKVDGPDPEPEPKPAAAKPAAAAAAKTAPAAAAPAKTPPAGK